MCDVCFAKHHQVGKTQIAHRTLARAFCVALIWACRLKRLVVVKKLIFELCREFGHDRMPGQV